MTLIHPCDVSHPQNVGISYGNNKTLPRELNPILIFVTTLVIPVSARINMGGKPATAQQSEAFGKSTSAHVLHCLPLSHNSVLFFNDNVNIKNTKFRASHRPMLITFENKTFLKYVGCCLDTEVAEGFLRIQIVLAVHQESDK